MALISAKTILTSLSLFHITLAFFFLTNPGTIADQSLVYVLGEAMGMSYSPSFEAPSAPSSFLAIVLGLIGISDLTSLSMPEDVWMLHYWGAQAPLRVLFFGVWVAYTFLFSASKSGGGIFAHPTAPFPNSSFAATSGLDALKNRVFFTFAFVQMLSWFWVWVTLREEQRDLVIRMEKARKISSSRYE